MENLKLLVNVIAPNNSDGGFEILLPVSYRRLGYCGATRLRKSSNSHQLREAVFSLVVNEAESNAKDWPVFVTPMT